MAFIQFSLFLALSFLLVLGSCENAPAKKQESETRSENGPKKADEALKANSEESLQEQMQAALQTIQLEDKMPELALACRLLRTPENPLLRIGSNQNPSDRKRHLIRRLCGKHQAALRPKVRGEPTKLQMVAALDSVVATLRAVDDETARFIGESSDYSDTQALIKKILKADHFCQEVEGILDGSIPITDTRFSKVQRKYVSIADNDCKLFRKEFARGTRVTDMKLGHRKKQTISRSVSKIERIIRRIEVEIKLKKKAPLAEEADHEPLIQKVEGLCGTLNDLVYDCGLKAPIERRQCDLLLSSSDVSRRLNQIEGLGERGLLELELKVQRAKLHCLLLDKRKVDFVKK